MTAGNNINKYICHLMNHYLHHLTTMFTLSIFFFSLLYATLHMDAFQQYSFVFQEVK